MTMPPAPIEYQGHAAIAGFMRHIGFRDGNRRYRLLPTRANGQAAFLTSTASTVKLLTGTAPGMDALRAALATELGVPEEGLAVVGD